MKTFVLYRSCWDRNNHLNPSKRANAASRLYRPETETFCILGQIALQCGYRKDQLLYQAGPASLGQTTNHHLFPEVFYTQVKQEKKSSFLTHELIVLNDSPNFSEAERELKLQQRLLQEGIQLTIKDHPEPGEDPWRNMFAE